MIKQLKKPGRTDRLNTCLKKSNHSRKRYYFIKTGNDIINYLFNSLFLLFSRGLCYYSNPETI